MLVTTCSSLLSTASSLAGSIALVQGNAEEMCEVSGTISQSVHNLEPTPETRQGVSP